MIEISYTQKHSIMDNILKITFKNRKNYEIDTY